jgi:excisionase family DNA binding protein
VTVTAISGASTVGATERNVVRMTKLRQISSEELREKLWLHEKWLRSEEGGEKADFGGYNLVRARFGFEDLREAVFTGANLFEASLPHANLAGADLSHADLRGADLSNAILQDADLRGADLSCTDFSGADLADAYLAFANLTGANFAKAILEGATGIPHPQDVLARQLPYSITSTGIRKNLLTTDEAAERLGIPEERVSGLIQRGRLKAERIYLIDEEAVNSLAEQGYVAITGSKKNVEKRQFIIDHHKKMTIEDMSDALGISYGMVRHHIRDLHGADVIDKNEIPRKKVENRKGRPRSLEAEERRAFIKDHYGKMPVEEIAQTLNISKAYVYQVGRKLKMSGELGGGTAAPPTLDAECAEARRAVDRRSGQAGQTPTR